MRARADAGQPLFDVSVVTTPKTVERRVIEADITREHSSLVGSLDAEGKNVELALRLADILGGEVDFNSDLQRGDRISALFERVIRNGTPGEYGDIEAAVLAKRRARGSSRFGSMAPRASPRGSTRTAGR